MGAGTKKEYLHVGDLPVLVKTLLAFLHSTDCEEIVITVPAGHIERVGELIAQHLPEQFQPLIAEIRITEGGESRQESVFLGLQAFTAGIEYCLIHDGARPWVSRGLIQTVLRDCIVNESSIPVIPVTDAVKRVDMDGNIEEHLARNRTVGAQTPQAFAYPAILDAHRRASGDGTSYIDDSEIFSRYVGTVHTVTGDPDNVKITFPRDLDRDGSEHSE
jgi:2-C-methyl-D-erythritol 4-phosphate cytidylyltransferase